MYDPEVLEHEVAQFLTEIFPGVDEHYVCMFRDCGMIAHTAYWMQRFSRRTDTCSDSTTAQAADASTSLSQDCIQQQTTRSRHRKY